MKKIFLLTTLCVAFIAFTANAQFTTLLNFNNTDGWGPPGDLITDGTYLYGMTMEGGVSNYGVVFRIKPDGSHDSVLLSFNGTNGNGPQGSLITDGKYLYGMTTHGGPLSEGVIFRMKPDGTGDTVIYNMGGASGSYPHGSLYYDGTYLYGMTTYGGSGSNGVIFKVKPNGTNFSIMLNFNGTDGQYANYCTLISDGTFLYGMTPSGGTNSDGVIFKIRPSGTTDSVLLNFNGTNGSQPNGSLYYDGTYLYGMTYAGGAHNGGVIFKVKSNGTGYVDLYDFPINQGEPYGSLTPDGNYLFGMTSLGGGKSFGNLFRIKTSGSSWADLLDFTGSANGMNPSGSLLNSGGVLYGMVNGGGANGFGVIFKMDTAVTGINEVTANSAQVKLFPNPNNGIFTIQSSVAAHGLSVEIYNVLGEKVFTQYPIPASHYSVDMSANAPGIYIYRVLSSSGDVVSDGKFVIQK